MIHSLQNHVECNVIFFHGDVYRSVNSDDL